MLPWDDSVVALTDPNAESHVKGRQGALERMAVVNRVAAFIDAHLDAPLCLSDLAHAGRLSKFHLHRVFLQQTSFTPAEFVNQTRLRSAINTLRARPRETTVLSTALSVGFNDHSAFTRAFRRNFGLTPERVRMSDFSRITRARIPIRSESTLIEFSGFTRVVLPAFSVYGFEVEGLNERTFVRAAKQGYEALFDVLERLGIERGTKTVAVPLLYQDVLPESAYRLLCAVRSETKLQAKGIVERRVRGGEWLKARHIGPHSTRWQTWYRLDRASARLKNSWDDRLPFEVLHESEPTTPLDELTVDVYFPI